MLGTFWRDTAVEQEEIDFFATGHPIVEALFGFLRDGPYGRNGCRSISIAARPRAAWRCSSTSYLWSRRTPLRERAFPRGSSRACWTEVSSAWR